MSAGELKGLSDCISFLLHTCVAFFFCMVLACVRAHVKLQSRAIWPMLWHLRHSTLYMNKNSWFLLAKLFLGGCRRLQHLSLWDGWDHNIYLYDMLYSVLPYDQSLNRNNNNQKMNFGTWEMEVSLMYFWSLSALRSFDDNHCLSHLCHHLYFFLDQDFFLELLDTNCHWCQYGNIQEEEIEHIGAERIKRIHRRS